MPKVKRRDFITLLGGAAKIGTGVGTGRAGSSRFLRGRAGSVKRFRHTGFFQNRCRAFLGVLVGYCAAQTAVTVFCIASNAPA